MLDWAPALSRPELLAAPVLSFLSEWPSASAVEVAPIDATLADTEAFCAAYGIALAESANCVVVAGRRGAETTLAACMVLATMRADVNGFVRKHLNARKASFAPLEAVEASSGMTFGGITPVGLPSSWPVLVSPEVAALPSAVIGSGIRGSKLRLPGSVLASLPGASVLPISS